MQVKFIGPYRDGYSGWARAAQSYILALDKVGVKVKPESYRLNDDLPCVDDRIIELEQQDIKPDILIHCGLPHNFEYDSRYKNVGIFFTETNDYTGTGWERHANLMDFNIVPSISAARAASRSGVKAAICPPPVIFSNEDCVVEDLLRQSRGDFLFYYVGDMGLRKNLPAMLRAFHMAFTPNEPVSLVLKLSSWGKSPEEIRELFKVRIREIQGGLKLRDRYKKEILITESLSTREVNALHNTCDCFLSTSSGEAFGYSIFDAILAGNQVITSNVGIMQELQIDYKVKVHEEPCFAIESFDFLFTSDESWKRIDINDLVKKMRLVYENRNNKNTRLGVQKDYIEKLFSLETVGNRLKGILEKL